MRSTHEAPVASPPFPAAKTLGFIRAFFATRCHKYYITYSPFLQGAFLCRGAYLSNRPRDTVFSATPRGSGVQSQSCFPWLIINSWVIVFSSSSLSHWLSFSDGYLAFHSRRHRFCIVMGIRRGCRL